MMSNSKTIAEHISPVIKLEGTPDQVAKALVLKVIAPAVRKLSENDKEIGIDFCVALIANISACINKTCDGDAAKFTSVMSGIAQGMDMAVAGFQAKPTVH